MLLKRSKPIATLIHRKMNMDLLRSRVNDYIKEVQETAVFKSPAIVSPENAGKFRASSIIGVFFFSLFSGALVAKSCAWFLDHHSLYVYVEDDDD
ncbi:unnamed protein product [Auanema sp. JU1783]|nr:unnamed protein product [Auanema sp. JU1783]